MDMYDKYAPRIAPLGFLALTPVQKKVIPHIEAGESLLFQSETGTGKTFAYLLPLLSRIEEDDDKSNGRLSPRLIVVSPTLELASQIKAFAGQITNEKCALLFGGASIKRQTSSLKEKPAVAIGSAARLCELIALKKLKTKSLAAVVFDEADALTKKEAAADTRALLDALPQGLQVVGCSATVSSQARKFFSDRAGVTAFIECQEEDVLKTRVEHWALFAERRDKASTLRRVLCALHVGESRQSPSPPAKVLVFAARGYDVENITSRLLAKSIPCEGLYAKSDKQKRKAALDRFRSGKVSVLVTSDLAARGLDIKDVTHVVQTDLCDDAAPFIHRAGRTARAGESGVNIVIGDEAELRRLRQIEKRLGIQVHPKALFGGQVVSATS